MAFDVFISYPHQDKAAADAACARLEAEGIRCWIAPRDVPPGSEWAGAIVDAIDQCRAMVLIFSSSTNASRQIHREVQRAFDREVPVVPLRIADVVPEKSLAYYMATVHWLDAMTPPLESHLHKLVASVKPLMRIEPPAVENVQRRDRHDGAAATADLRAGGNTAGRPAERRSAGQSAQASRAPLVLVGVLAVLVIGAIGGWLAISHHSPPAAASASATSPATIAAAPANVTLAPMPAVVGPTPAPGNAAPAVKAPAASNNIATAPPGDREHVEKPNSAAISPETTPAVPAVDSAALEVLFWNSIKDSKNPELFEAYLRRYPDGTFADIARINIVQLKAAAEAKAEEAKAAEAKAATARVAEATPVSPKPDEKTPISDPGLLREIRDRLYELNFDPASADAAGLAPAIRQFEAQSKLAVTGEATAGLLSRLRELDRLAPWGAIVYDQGAAKWGMAWDQATRKDAVASARSQCGSASCAAEVSFFATSCGAFALSAVSWSIVSRGNIQDARQAALDECGKRGKVCRVIGASCATAATGRRRAIDFLFGGGNAAFHGNCARLERSGGRCRSRDLVVGLGRAIGDRVG
jgi:hypothetical protein